MAGKTPRPQATQERILTPVLTQCPECGRRMWWDYTNDRKVATLEGGCGWDCRSGAVQTQTVAVTIDPTGLKRKAGSCYPITSMA
jgi:hypothetical protein